MQVISPYQTPLLPDSSPWETPGGKCGVARARSWQARDRTSTREESRLNRELWQGLVMLTFLSLGKPAVAQSPVGSAPPAKSEQTTGITLNTAFHGSVDSGSRVFDWTTTTGYIFNKHFSADVGVPILLSMAPHPPAQPPATPACGIYSSSSSS